MSVAERVRQVMQTKPRRFQTKGIRFLERLGGRAILGDEMGLGKTYQALAYLAIHPELRPAVILCPASLKLQWRREAAYHAGLRTEVLEGRAVYRPRRDIWILNYDILGSVVPAERGRGVAPKGWLRYLCEAGVRLVVFDECHFLKNGTAQRTKASKFLAGVAHHVIGLSGTPITNRPVEFFPVLNMVAPSLFPSFWRYAFRYCNPKRAFRGRGWDFSGSDNLEELHERTRDVMLRRTKADVLSELPRKQRVPIPLALANLAEYLEAETLFVRWLAKNKGVRAVQRAQGALAMVRLQALLTLAALGKTPAVAEWAGDVADDQKVILFTRRHDVTDVYSRLLPKALVLDGRLGRDARQEVVDRFQRDDKARILIGGLPCWTGLNLTAAAHVGFCELAWTPGEHAQAEDRVHRIGQTRGVVCHYFIGQGTVEEHVLQVLDDKRKVVSHVLDGKPVGMGVTAQFAVMQKLLDTKGA